MSAAEKLKALNVRYNSDIADLPDYGPEDEYGTVIINALPQIVAVVEAAEETHARARGYSEVPISDLREIELILERALDALDEVLI